MVVLGKDTKKRGKPASRAGQGRGREAGGMAEQAQASSCRVDAEEQNGNKPMRVIEVS